MNRLLSALLLIGPGFGINGLGAESVREQPDGEVSFAEEVLPILRRNCFRCHGSKNQEAGLQLNLRSTVLGDEAPADLVVRHAPDESFLIKRISDDREGDLMPIDADPLSPRDVKILRRWIAAGAVWPDEFAAPRHWAYQPILRPAIALETKESGTESGARNAIDHFVLQRLARHNLTLQPAADRPRLLRRVALALTGVPPTPADVDAFVADTTPDAYEHAVDRLLESPAYGERWSVPWLDLARYADSNGFQADQIRDNWAYRDWVIRSINDDQPFDDFVI